MLDKKLVNERLKLVETRLSALNIEREQLTNEASALRSLLDVYTTRDYDPIVEEATTTGHFIQNSKPYKRLAQCKEEIYSIIIDSVEPVGASKLKDHGFSYTQINRSLGALEADGLIHTYLEGRLRFAVGREPTKVCGKEKRR